MVDRRRQARGPGAYDRGFFVEPTIFDDVKPGMRIAQEEIFGPVLSVLSSDDEEEALAIANDTRYGLVPRCGRATSGRPCAWPAGSRPDRSRSTRSGQAA